MPGGSSPEWLTADACSFFIAGMPECLKKQLECHQRLPVRVPFHMAGLPDN